MPFVRRKFVRRSRRPAKISPKVKRYVRKAIHRNVENKFGNYDLTSAFGSVGNSWSETEFTNIAQGTTVNQRVGQNITARALSINGVIAGGQVNLATDDKVNTVRMVLALWDSTTATPLSANAATINSYISKEQSAGRGLIKKYMDKVITLSSSGRDSTGYLPVVKHIRKFIKCRSYIRYTASGSTTASRKLILSIITDSSVVPHPGFTQGFMTFFYEDA